jgi:hypothetical protein
MVLPSPVSGYFLATVANSQNERLWNERPFMALTQDTAVITAAASL